MRSSSEHAFASGPARLQPRANLWFLLDWIFYLIEYCYEQYRCRRIWRMWMKKAVIGKEVRLGGNARLVNRNDANAMKVGNKVVCRGIIRVESQGKLTIQDEVYVGDDVIISAANSVEIGRGTLLAHGVQIFDNTSHPIDWQQRKKHFKKLLGESISGAVAIPSEPVYIGEYCWLGTGVVVLKGVSIGDRSIIGAGCIITKDVPPDTLVVSDGTRFINIQHEEIDACCNV